MDASKRIKAFAPMYTPGADVSYGLAPLLEGTKSPGFLQAPDKLLPSPAFNSIRFSGLSSTSSHNLSIVASKY